MILRLGVWHALGASEKYMHSGIPSEKPTVTDPWVRSDLPSELKKYSASILAGRPVGSCDTIT